MKNLLSNQLKIEESYLKQMSLVKADNSSLSFKHKMHRINPRSKVNLYVNKRTNKAMSLTTAVPTVEGSLMKSRMVTQRWVAEVGKKTGRVEGLNSK